LALYRFLKSLGRVARPKRAAKMKVATTPVLGKPVFQGEWQLYRTNSAGFSDENELLLRVFLAILLDPLAQEPRRISVANAAKPNLPVKTLEVGVRYPETRPALQEQPNFFKYSCADALPLELSLNPHASQYLDSVLVCDPHHANEIIPAQRANDNISGLYAAAVTREPVELPNTLELTSNENWGHASSPLCRLFSNSRCSESACRPP
jgi:hypothetical protein